MKTRILEVRDEGTCIPVLAIKMQAVMGDDCQTVSAARVRDYWLHQRTGYPRDGSAIVVMRLSDQGAKVDPYDWPGQARTMRVAHEFIYSNFNKLQDGDVVDVRVILKLATEPAVSEMKLWPNVET